MNRFLLPFFVVAFVAACALPVKREPATFTPASEPGRVIRIEQDVGFRLSTGYSRTIRAGSTWQFRGTMDGHDVYKSEKEVFTVEGQNVHEAWLVVDNDSLIGFYLAGENAVSWLKEKVALQFQ